MSRRILPLGIALCVGLLSGLVWVSPATAAVRVKAPSPSVSRPILNEAFTLSGSLGRSVKRPIRLQRFYGGKWRNVRKKGTGKLGRYTFTVRQPTTTARWRVLAPSVKRNGRRWATRVTRPRTVTRQGQAGSVSAPESVRAGTPATIRARFTPARPGRVVTLDRLLNGTWSRVGTARQDGSGVATFAFTPPQHAWMGFRATAASARGAAPVVTATTRTVALPAQPVLVAAHRGASATHPENTLPAIRKAIELKADLLELDFRRTSDGHWVMVHDGDLRRTTNIEQVPALAARQTEGISKFSLAEIKMLDAGSWKGRQFACPAAAPDDHDCRVPTLEEALRLISTSGYPGRLILEVKEFSASKVEADRERLKQFYETVRTLQPAWISATGRDDKAIFMTFDEGAAKYLNDLYGTAPTETLPDAQPDGVEVAVVVDRSMSLAPFTWANQLHIREDLWWSGTEAHASAVAPGVELAAWTVNSFQTIGRSVGIGADIVTTDDVPYARRLLQR